MSSAICSRSMSGVYPTPPITPRPPALCCVSYCCEEIALSLPEVVAYLVTAAASLGPAATFIPASMMGWLIFRRSVVTVRSFSIVRSVTIFTHAAHVTADRDVRGEAMMQIRCRSTGDEWRRSRRDAGESNETASCGREMSSAVEVWGSAYEGTLVLGDASVWGGSWGSHMPSNAKPHRA